jgi:hypothetical protein
LEAGLVGHAILEWRYVMPGNWDHVQNIVTGLVPAPQGPLVLVAGQTPRWVDAWIVQSSTGSSQTFYGSASSGAFNTPGKWIANVRLYSRGTFQPGLAVGIALVHVKHGINNEYFWWSEDPIELQ